MTCDINSGNCGDNINEDKLYSLKTSRVYYINL